MSFLDGDTSDVVFTVWRLLHFSTNDFSSFFLRFLFTFFKGSSMIGAGLGVFGFGFFKVPGGIRIEVIRAHLFIDGSLIIFSRIYL